MKRVLVLLVLIATTAIAQPTTPAAPQRPPKPQEQLDAMAKLDYLTGRWVGSGWTDMGSGKMPFNGSESVQRKLDGLALLVEGDFYSGQVGMSTPVHQTLGVITYDPKAKSYRFVSWLANGSTGERELTVTSSGWSWDIKAAGATMRYTFTLTPQGDWLEKGERSTDGTTWKQFFEMKLSKEL